MSESVLSKNEKNMLENVKVFNKDALQVVESTPLFNEEEKNELMLASENMQSAFFNSQIYRTETEARTSVLNNARFPTIASKFYQSLKEMNVHQGELVNLLYQYETKNEDINIIKADIMELEDELEGLENNEKVKDYDLIKVKAQINKKYIQLKQYNFELKNMKRVADDRKREILMWDKILNELKPKLEEDNIPMDDPNYHQALSYALRDIKKLIQALNSSKDEDQENIESIHSRIIQTVQLLQQRDQTHLLEINLSAPEKYILLTNGILNIRLNKDDLEHLKINYKDNEQVQNFVEHYQNNNVLEFNKNEN